MSSPLEFYPPPWLAHLLPATTSGGPDPITFPTTPLRLKAEVALGADLTADPATWGWQDITALVYTRDSVVITRGRPDESSTADTGKLTLTVNNRNGYFSTRNPSSPWFGLLRKGTPIRVFAEGYIRFTGFITALPPRWDLSGNDRWAPIEAQGLLYRLAQGVSPVRSAMKRTLLARSPIAYWPMESLSLGSALTGGTNATMTGDVLAVAGPAGSDTMMDFTAGQVMRWTCPGSTQTSWQVEFVFATVTTLATFPVLAQWSAIGDAPLFQVTGGPVGSGGLGFTYYSGGTAHGASSNVAMDDGEYHHVRVEANSSSFTFNVYLDGVFVIGTGALGFTIGNVTDGVLNPGKVATISAMGHLAVTTPVSSAGNVASAMLGYPGELAHVRFARLCAEEGITYSVRAPDSQAMGVQGVDSIVPLLRECEATDQGYLFEGLNFGLVLQGHIERENQITQLALDYLTSPITDFAPTDDDQSARNDIEVIRDGGASARLIESSATQELSTVNIGPRDDSQTYSLATDDQAYQLAGWRLHVATWPGYRYPGLSLNLAAAAARTGDTTIDQAARNALITAVCTADLGYRATVDNPPTDIGPDDPSVIVEGYTETLGQFDWEYVANCSLQGPWDVSLLAQDTGDTDAHLGWVEFDSCTVGADVDTTATAWSVTCSPADAATSDDLPRQHLVDGELITVTASTGGTSPTWTVTRSVNGVVKAHGAGAVINTVHPFVLAL